MNGAAEAKASRQAENTLYRRENRAFFRGMERCTECGAKDAFTMNGRWRCAECAEKANEYNSDYYKRNADGILGNRKALRSYRRENHLCTECGRPLSPTYSFATCEGCRAANRRKRERLRREHGVIPRSEWRELGLCMRCGAPRMHGWLSCVDKEIELCEKCYCESAEGLAKGRKNFMKQHGMSYGTFAYEYENFIRHGSQKDKLKEEQ